MTTADEIRADGQVTLTPPELADLLIVAAADARGADMITSPAYDLWLVLHEADPDLYVRAMTAAKHHQRGALIALTLLDQEIKEGRNNQ